MKVFASKYLESFSNANAVSSDKWIWMPHDKSVCEIYASGNLTSSTESTYAAEKDTRSDHDRPNEGMLIA